MLVRAWLGAGKLQAGEPASQFTTLDIADLAEQGDLVSWEVP